MSSCFSFYLNLFRRVHAAKSSASLHCCWSAFEQTSGRQDVSDQTFLWLWHSDDRGKLPGLTMPQPFLWDPSPHSIMHRVHPLPTPPPSHSSVVTCCRWLIGWSETAKAQKYDKFGENTDDWALTGHPRSGSVSPPAQAAGVLVYTEGYLCVFSVMKAVQLQT